MPDPLSSLLLLSLSLRAPSYVLLLPFASQVVVVPFVRATYSHIVLWTHFVLLLLPARFKRLVGPNPSAPSAPIDAQAPSLGMGLGIPSILDTVPRSPLPISPLEQVGEVVDSPTEELPGAPFDALLSEAPNVPQTPDLPVINSLPPADDQLIQLLADKDNLVSAMTQETLEAASEGEPVDPYALINRLDKLKAANERIDALFGLTPTPIQDATGALPVRRQVPDPNSPLSRLKEHLLDVPKPSGTCFAIPPLSLSHSYPF
jgi:hypothetical protein